MLSAIPKKNLILAVLKCDEQRITGVKFPNGRRRLSRGGGRTSYASQLMYRQAPDKGVIRPLRQEPKRPIDPLLVPRGQSSVRAPKDRGMRELHK